MWRGDELASRLQVSGRTLRNDIERLRQLDYPVEAVRGPGGHYRLGVGAKLPPLLLDDDEAVAVAVVYAPSQEWAASRTPVPEPWPSWRLCSPIGSGCGSTPCAMPCRPGLRTRYQCAGPGGRRGTPDGRRGCDP